MAASGTDLKPGDPVVSVCVTCKAAQDAELRHGPVLVERLRAALGEQVVRPVQCLGVCKRPTTVAVSAPQGFTFIFGDLEPDAGPAAIASFVQSYRVADYGFVPWRQRPEILRRGLVARLPPAAWSPEDGAPPA